MNIEFRLLFTYSKPLLKLNQTCLFGMREQTCYMFVAEAQTCWEVNLTLSLSPALLVTVATSVKFRSMHWCQTFPMR